MTDFNKYESILRELSIGTKQSSIVREYKCSYGTITRAKKWGLERHSEGIYKSLEEVSIPLPIENSNVNVSENVSEIIVENSSEIVVENSSEKLGVETKIPLAPEGIIYNSRWLSWLALNLGIPKYWNLSKDQLKAKIHEKISKI